ncbi:hypothetical protein MYCTH_2125144 [Thermothelomyces thermophilus ATCC 42464]|uniref:Uncharacterized protein n=1 Tax=Thermothelomyces thermophilus (strain ATCC 42464 / BCRC 31852 / DSM 1799) TaxID=573729 RepID=G2Q878_THET4|nr:uncharacterized protein MYCTH_2125144 [Thermothelomyces thermophilus ATCC 42464]AEO56181.1 hypothetical protein MYCTH_2125144 [Thermothelomyces thermophilus ATCC 42464]
MPSTTTQPKVPQTSINFSGYCVVILRAQETDSSSRPTGGTTQSTAKNQQKSFPPFSPPIAINTDLSQLGYFTHSLPFGFRLPAGLCYEFDEFVLAEDE